MLRDTPDEMDPCWRDRWHSKITTAEEAIALVKPGQRIFIGTGCAQPLPLILTLTGRSTLLADNEIIDLFTLGEAPYAQQALSDHIHVNTFFIAENVRDSVQKGVGSYTPVFLSDVPRLFSSYQIPLDIALIQVSPPDADGWCSLGISVDIVATAVRYARLVIAQVNSFMPRTLGDSFVHVDDLHWLVPVDFPLAEYEPAAADAGSRQVAENVATLVEDGSTLELGIGLIPQEVLHYLAHRKDLGIHSEMMTDSMVDLVQSGVVTGRCKTLDPGQIVVSFCMGTRKLYDFVHNNPMISFRPTEYVNDPFVIAQQRRMVAINVALEVDLTGQVCADSLGSRFFSGIGGQVDFNRGAARAVEGRAVIALPSTACDGAVSRIVTRLAPGAGVVTTRGDVHYVVTEYGVAYLHGRTIHQRALSLISIAHPKFRDILLREAIEAHYLHPELADVQGRFFVEPQGTRTTLELDGGERVVFRAIHPTDEQPVRELFYSLSHQSVYYRFMTHLKRLTFRQLKDFIYIDHRVAVAIVGVIPVSHREEIIAMGGYYLDQHTNRAEVALIVRDDWQGRGIGAFMLDRLITLARRSGIAGFTATVLPDNRTMQRAFKNTRLPIRCQMEDGVLSYEVDFSTHE
ncbi:MAG: GNAT family N-acetyltransferase [Magnetococcales bacterium]|nr:GNAT family N-acetyltransferase [Magnetococcales bacterium]